jgi:GNAT superfamily N-acetyltransferase
MPADRSTDPDVVSLRDEFGDVDLEAYAAVPTAFVVTKVLVREVVPGGKFRLVERPVFAPWTKDYDSLPANHPTMWPEVFVDAEWDAFAARRDGQTVGEMVIVRWLSLSDAWIWDIRVRPELRRTGIGGALVSVANQWASERDCDVLRVETQNINVPACRFYRRARFTLERVDEDAYPTLPDEIQFIWSKAPDVAG